MEEDPKSYTPKPPGKVFYAGWVMAVLAVVGATTGLVLARELWINRQTTELQQQIAHGPRVLVMQVKQAPSIRKLDLPVTVRGYIETPVYAKVPGYLKKIYVDKGDRVKQGQLIAELESPELDHQVANARANYNLQVVTDRRNRELLREGVIAQQAEDDSHAALLQAKATLRQLEATQAYEVITAPFDGIVTARYVDPGALIPQTTTPATGAQPIVALATLSPLRVYAYAPQSVTPYIHDGDPAIITVSEYPGRDFDGTITRHPEALAADSRTMLVEVDLANEDRALYPGMYGRMRFRARITTGAPVVPDDALVFRDGQTYVPVVREDRLRLVEVTLGYDDGQMVEITRGVSSGDLVAVNVGQAVNDGQVVQPIIMNDQQR